jgi:gas vesicle protein
MTKVRSIWKGLVIGGLMGAAVGAISDLFGGGARLVGVAGKKAVDMAPEAAERVRTAVNGGVARVQEAEIADHLRDQARELVHRVGESDHSEQVREAFEETAKQGERLAHSMHNGKPLHPIG